jgi:dihydroflavonol-4-reductase
MRVTYIRAKTEAERRAWPLAKELGVNMVTVLPGGICGPGFSRNTPSLDVIEAMMYGAFRMGVPDANFPYVDVRDVVSAHLLAAERDAQGRFIAINDEQPYFRTMLEAMHRIDPRVKPPLMSMPEFMVPALPLFDRLNAMTLGTPRIAAPDLMATLRGRRWNASNRRAREVLGWAPKVSLEESLRDTMAVFRARREKTH